jgi:hypothetical protein
MYLTLANIVPFWLCYNIRSTAIQCLQLYIVLIFFLNIPIPRYIFIKQMSLFVLGGTWSCVSGRRLPRCIKILFNYQGELNRYQAWPSAKDLFYPFLAMPTTPHSKKQQNHTNIECSVYLMFKVCCLSR